MFKAVKKQHLVLQSWKGLGAGLPQLASMLKGKKRLSLRQGECTDPITWDHGICAGGGLSPGEGDRHLR